LRRKIAYLDAGRHHIIAELDMLLTGLEASYGFAEIPEFDAAQTSALDALLSSHAIKELVARLDNQWSKKATEQVDIYQ
jgi:hypothetical protein